MERLALLATLHARPGKEQEVEAFLKSALPLAEQEPATRRWYAFNLRWPEKESASWRMAKRLTRRKFER